MKACRVARRLAIDNFQLVEVTSACIVFISLLAQDTSLLRLHLQVANQLAAHLSNQIAAVSSVDQSSTDDVAYDPVVTTKVRECITLTIVMFFQSTVTVIKT